jgi:hypothetical protein
MADANEQVRAFVLIKGVSAAAGRSSKNAGRIIPCLTVNYTDYLQIAAKAARIVGS